MDVRCAMKRLGDVMVYLPEIHLLEKSSECGIERWIGALRGGLI